MRWKRWGIIGGVCLSIGLTSGARAQGRPDSATVRGLLEEATSALIESANLRQSVRFVRELAERRSRWGLPDSDSLMALLPVLPLPVEDYLDLIEAGALAEARRHVEEFDFAFISW